MSQFRGRQSFTVPGVAGNYAPEELLIGTPASGTNTQPVDLGGVTVGVETIGAATGVSIELWLLAIGQDPATPANWYYSGQSVSSGSATWMLAKYPGGKLRAKSAGTAGTAVISASAE